MNVLHVVAGLEVRHGGPPRVVASLTSALKRAGVSSTIFSPVFSGDREHLIDTPDADIRLFGTGKLSRWWPGHSPDMKSALEDEAADYDIVHIHEMWHHPHFAAARASRALGIPFVISPHGSLDPWALALGGLKKRIYSRIWQRDILRNAAAAHGLTDTEANQIRDYGFDGPVPVIPNGIDAGEFQQTGDVAALEHRYPELKGKRVVLFLGRLHEKKGLDLLLEAFIRLHKTRPDTHLLIVGPDDGYRQTLEESIKRAGLSAVTLTGPFGGDERVGALSRADVYALPSYSEGFSVGVLEALAAGIPSVISTFCYFPEVETAGAGLVVKPKVNEVESALCKILDSPDLSATMGRSATDLVRRGYAWNTIAESYVEMYQAATSTKTG
ncbi:MAG: glycosyltransferase [Chloroflexi bacterium]|jgi:glycosyltransferase involved in cell wall biosynthesis|nr:glycosyltransferase [Chloroflexota bacterium]MBT4515059.1 glycosyltransferase [Chloroflexota bacterium]MBT6681428.1 glycosyltransferase [Chloroflexota bacterium]